MNKTIYILLGALGISIGTYSVSRLIESWKETNRMIERGKALDEETERLTKIVEQDKKDYDDFMKRKIMEHEEIMAILNME